METVLDQNMSEKENIKLEKIAFITLILALIYIFLKFFNYIFTSTLILDSELIPDNAIKFALKESFYSGLILSFGIVITFYLYRIKKYQTVIFLNVLFIVQSLALPYVLNLTAN